MSGTCCTDQEFTELYHNASQNIDKLRHIFELHMQVIQDLVSLSEQEFDAIFTGIDHEIVSAQFDIEELKQNMTTLREEADEYQNRTDKALEFVVRSGSGMVCGICAPENQNMMNLVHVEDEDDSYSVNWSAQECLSILQDENIGAYGDFLNDVIDLYRVSYLLNLKFKMELDFSKMFISKAYEGKFFDFGEDPCRMNKYFFDNFEECTDQCNELGVINEIPLFFILEILAQNSKFIHDYSVDRQFLQDSVPDSSNHSKKIEIDSSIQSSANKVLVISKPLDKEQVEAMKQEMQQEIENIFDDIKVIFYVTPVPNCEIKLKKDELIYVSNGGWENKIFGSELFIKYIEQKNESKIDEHELSQNSESVSDHDHRSESLQKSEKSKRESEVDSRTKSQEGSVVLAKMIWAFAIFAFLGIK